MKLHIVDGTHGRTICGRLLGPKKETGKTISIYRHSNGYTDVQTLTDVSQHARHDMCNNCKSGIKR